VDEPRRLAPQALGLLFVAQALLDPVAAEDEQIAEHDVAGLVDPAREQHAARVVGREQRELLGQDLGQRRLIGARLTVERHAHRAGRRGDLVDGGEVRAEEVGIHGCCRGVYTPRG
jgi:hypothetical protein